MTAPISIMHFTNERERGGVEEHVLTLLRGLDRQRFALRLVCTPELHAALRADLPADVAVSEIALRGLGDGGAVVQLARLLRRTRPQVLHAHLFYASLLAAPIARLCGVRAVVETTHVREHWRRGWKANYAIDRLAARLVDRYIAVSAANAKYLREEKRIPAAKIRVIANGCDLRRCQASPGEEPALRRRLGIAAGDPVLVTLARLEPQKGHGLLLEAMAEVQRRHPRVHLVCVGEGRLRGALEAQRQGLPDPGRVHLVGFQREVAAYLEMASATVLPSLYEGMPLAAIESLGAERPVLASAVDGTPEVVRHGENGLLFAPGSAAAISDALCEGLRDPARLREWGRRGRRRVEARFSQRAQVVQTEQLYREVCGHACPAADGVGVRGAVEREAA